MKSSRSAVFIVLLFITGISAYYKYTSMWSLPPQGAHIWRQADAAAMAQNYQQFKLPFTQPATYNLQSEEGKVAGEFPVFYFIAAQFNDVAFVLRILHSLLFILSIFAIYFIAMHFLKEEVLSIFVSVLFFTSPLLVFYGNNFLSDIPALSFVFIGWAFFLYNYQKSKLVWISIAILCFTMAALLKASQAIFGLVLAFVFYSFHLWKHQKNNLKSLLLFLPGLLPVFWYAYAKSYNLQHHDTYYFLSIAPVWKLSLQDIGLGIWRMVVSNSKNYFWQPTSIFLILSVYFLLLKWKKVSSELQLLITTSLVVTLIYILIFYQKMIGHEYYYSPFFVFALFGTIGILKVYHSYHAENIFGHTALFLLLIPNIIFCKSVITAKQTDAMYHPTLASKEIPAFLEKNGITENKIIVSLPDVSPNQTLYQLKRKGYTAFNDYLSVLKNKQADYLLLTNTSLKNEPELKSFLTDSIADYHGITIYQLERVK